MTNEKRKLKFIKKEVLGVLGFLAIFILFFVGIYSGGGTYETVLYINDVNFSGKEVKYINLKRWNDANSTSELTYEVFQEDWDFNIETAEEVDALFTLSDNGKHMLYYDNEINVGWNYMKGNRYRILYLDGKEIDEEVEAYAANKRFNRITYLKWGELYQKKLLGTSHIASDVENFDISENGEKVLYLTDNNELYLWKSGRGSKLIDSDIYKVCAVLNDLNAVYYEKDNSIYKWNKRGKAKEVDSDIDDVIKIYDSGEMYYTKSETVGMNLMDYVEDDLKEADAANTNRDWSEEEIMRNYDLYMETAQRNDIRKQLQEENTLTYRSLYYYDGKSSKLVTDSMSPYVEVSVAENVPVMDIQLYSQMEKIKISEIPVGTDVDEYIKNVLNERSEHYVVSEDSMNLLPENKAEYVVINDEGSQLCFLDNIDDNEFVYDAIGNNIEGGRYCNGDLYQVKISDGMVGEPELLDVDVVEHSVEFLSEDVCAYFKNRENGLGTLFINGNEVDSNVAMAKDISIAGKTDAVYYYTDWDYDSSDACGTLKKYENGVKEKIYDGVKRHVFTNRGEVLFIADVKYASDAYSTLWYYSEGESKELTRAYDLVTGGESIDDSERGYNYGW